jgi:hypothetical protein
VPLRARLLDLLVRVRFGKAALHLRDEFVGQDVGERRCSLFISPLTTWSSSDSMAA